MSMSRTDEGQTPFAKALRKEELRGLPNVVFAVMFVVGLGLGTAIVLGVDVLVNVLLLVAMASLHGVLGTAIVGFVVEVVTARTQKWTDLSRRASLVLGLLGFASLAGSILLDRFALRGLRGEPRVWFVLVMITATLASGLLTFRVLSPRTDWLQGPSISALKGLAGFCCGAMAIVAAVGASAWYRNVTVSDGPPINELASMNFDSKSYVSLGDSYSAGEGLRPFKPGTESAAFGPGHGCHRSKKAYPELVKFKPSSAERFFACSGAVAYDVFHSYTSSGRFANVVVPAQSGQIENGVGLVTITMGGNDVVFSKVVLHCFLHTSCMRKKFHSPPDDPKRDLRFPATQPLLQWGKAAVKIVQSKVDLLYPRIKLTYPNARILVIGYPYLFPDNGAPIFHLNDCQSILRRFSRGERRAVRGLEDDLNEMLYKRALAAGIEFVSPAAGWDGHEPCGSKARGQYTNSIKPYVRFGKFANPVDGGTFHPNRAGQRELARLVTCYLRSPKATVYPVAAPGSLGHPVLC